MFRNFCVLWGTYNAGSFYREVYKGRSDNFILLSVKCQEKQYHERLSERGFRKFLTKCRSQWLWQIVFIDFWKINAHSSNSSLQDGLDEPSLYGSSCLNSSSVACLIQLLLHSQRTCPDRISRFHLFTTRFSLAPLDICTCTHTKKLELSWILLHGNILRPNSMPFAFYTLTNNLCHFLVSALSLPNWIYTYIPLSLFSYEEIHPNMHIWPFLPPAFA